MKKQIMFAMAAIVLSFNTASAALNFDDPNSPSVKVLSGPSINFQAAKESGAYCPNQDRSGTLTSNGVRIALHGKNPDGKTGATGNGNAFK